MNDFFYANACFVCRAYGPDVNFKRCSNCKMVGYCSREHQREHWPIHKEICKVLGNRIKLYGSIFPPKEENEIIDIQSWVSRKQNLLKLVQQQLGRQFLHGEVDILVNTRSCEVCHETNPQKLVDCSDCPSASFCQKHTNNDHQEKCKLTVLAHKLEHRPPPGTFNNFKVLNIGTNIPADLQGVANLYCEHYNGKKNGIPVDVWSVVNVEHLWRPYTFLYGIQKLSMSKFPRNIHVLGSELAEMATVAGWEVLLHHAKLSEDVVITFIGPELKDCGRSIQFGKKHGCKNKKIRVNTVGKLYHHYVSCDTYTEPDIIVGFNLGIHVSKYDWAPTIKEIKKLKCPLLVTTFTEVEMEADRHKINSILNTNVVPAYVEENPYHALMPIRNPVNETFGHSGYYLMIYEKL